MTEYQNLRQALQAIANIDDTTNHSVDASAALDRIGQIARQAIALPPADHLPDAGKMVNGLTKAETDASASVSGLTAAPVGDLPELPEPFALSVSVHEGDTPAKTYVECQLFQTPPNGKQKLYTADQMRAYARAARAARAALSAGDAADAQRWKTSELISRTALTPPKHRTETESIAFNAYRKAMESGQSYAACVDAAIDAAMRKGKP